MNFFVVRLIIEVNIQIYLAASTRHGEYFICSLNMHGRCYRWSAWVTYTRWKIQRYHQVTNIWSNITHNALPPSRPSLLKKRGFGSFGPTQTVRNFKALNIIQVRSFLLVFFHSKFWEFKKFLPNYSHYIQLNLKFFPRPCSIFQNSINSSWYGLTEIFVYSKNNDNDKLQKN